MGSARVALRLARRDVRRARGRSALVIVMIALPVLGVGAADVLYRTFALSPDQKATRLMGTADAVLSDTGLARIRQRSGSASGYDGTDQRTGPVPALAAVLPAGSRTVVDRPGPTVSLTFGDVTASTPTRQLAYTDPLARGIYLPRGGRPPAARGEVALTRALADRVHAGLGARVQLHADHLTFTGTVVGLVVDANSRVDRRVLLAPDTLPDDGRLLAPALVRVPRSLTWQDVRHANALGVLLLPRHRVAGEPAPQDVPGSSLRATTLTAASLVVGMALLEVILLAGPAFAVGAKRQSRELALLAASGAERKDIRAVVLGTGIVLGTAGGVLGALLGVGVGRLAVPLLSRHTSTLPGPFEVRPLELLGVALTGVVTAVLAALLPARSAARQDVVAALTGRRGALRSLKRVPLLGLVAAAVGTLLALDGATRRSVNTILAGSAVAELGLVAMTPFLVGVVGRMGRRLPLGPRLALRDAARNRSRTAPAVAAVLAAVAGSVAVGTYLASLDRFHERSYRAQAPYGSAVVDLSQATDAADAAAQARGATQALRATLPDATAITPVSALDEAPKAGTDQPGYVDLLPCGRPATCAPVRGTPGTRSPDATVFGKLVGDTAALAALLGRDASSYRGILARGGVVVPAADVRTGGTVELVLHPQSDPDGAHGRHLLLAAQALPYDVPQVQFFSPRAAAQVGYDTRVRAVLASAPRPPTSAQEDRARNELGRLDLDRALRVERGYQGSSALGLLALVVGSAVIVLGASGIATGLAAADGRADLATLAAVGATPGRRRSLAAYQSAVTAGLGTLLGTVAGLVPAVGMVRALNAESLANSSSTHYPLVLPWHNLLVTVLLVPTLAALAAATLTRSRLPLVRRTA